MSRTCFRVKPHLIVAWMSRNTLLKTYAKSEDEVTETGLEPRTTKFLKEHLSIWPNWPNDRAVFWVLTCTAQLTLCTCHVTYVFESESTLYSCLYLMELLASSRREIWRLSDCNWTRTKNHWVLKRTLNILTKLAKWSSCVLSTYLHSAFDCMFLSCHLRVSEWTDTL